MKVLLISPSNRLSFSSVPIVGYAIYSRVIYPPIALGYLASYLETRGHKVQIIDCKIENKNPNYLRKKIKDFEPDVVGITSTTQIIFKAMNIAKLSKEINPNCITVLGGPHVTSLSIETIKKCEFIDVVVRGEGELTFLELLEKKREKWEDVRSITYRKNGRIIKNKERELIIDLDSIPFPAFHLMSMDKYRVYGQLSKSWTSGELFSGILTSRGCPHNCAFCASNSLGKKWRARSPENVVEELDIIRNKYGIKAIEFLDDSFTVNEKRTIKICELIKKENIDISWSCSSRTDHFTKKIANCIKHSGCHSVFFGIESGNQKTLDFLNKMTTIDKANMSIKIAKKAGLNVITSFIIGIPNETKKDIMKTIKFAKKLNPTFALFNQLTPFPGTKIFEFAEKNNLLLTKDWSRYTTMSEPVMKIPGFSNEELKNILQKANVIFYLNPLYFYNVLKEMIDYENPHKILKDHIKIFTKKYTLLDSYNKKNEFC